MPNTKKMGIREKVFLLFPISLFYKDLKKYKFEILNISGMTCVDEENVLDMFFRLARKNFLEHLVLVLGKCS